MALSKAILPKLKQRPTNDIFQSQSIQIVILFLFHVNTNKFKKYLT
jgi:hypothetical protein